MQSGLKHRLILAVCGITHGVQDGISAALYVLLPILAQAFGLSYFQIGIVRATHVGAMTLFEIPSGVLSEWLGERRLLAFGLVCAGCGFVYLSFANGLWIILAALAIAGMGGGFQHALCSSIISKTFEVRGQHTALGLYNSAGDAGKLAFTGLFSLAVGLGLAWQTVVTGFGLIAIATGIVVLVALRGLRAGYINRPQIKASSEDAGIGWGILNPAGFSRLCAVVFLDTAVQAGFFTFIAFLILDRGLPQELAFTGLVLTMVGGIFGKAGCGYLADKIGPKPAFALVQCAAAAAIMVLVVAPATVMFVLLPLLGIFLQGSTSITYGSVGGYFHSDRRSRGFALIYTVSSLSAIAGPVLFGLIGDHFGLSASMTAMAVVSLMAVIPSLLSRSAQTAHSIC